MAEQWQLRKGNTAENEGFVGAEGELTVDTITKELHLHDGETAGGFRFLPILAMMEALMPDYSRTVSISLPYTAPCHGYVSGVLTAAHSENYYVKVNNVNVQKIYGETNQRVTGPFMIPVKKGDIVSATGGVNTLCFHPCSGN